MQNIIKHKWISSLAILIILVIVFAMSIHKSVEAVNFSTIFYGFKPMSVGPDEYVEMMFFNTICSESAHTTIRVANAKDGSLVDIPFEEDILPLKGAIESFDPDNGPGIRSNIVATIVILCPKNSLKFSGGMQRNPVILEIVDNDTHFTIRRIEPSSLLINPDEETWGFQ